MSGLLFKSNFFTNYDLTKFKESLDSLNHRGPDKTGILINDDFIFGHKSLKLKDVCNGNEPISLYDSHLILDGEIYNHSEISTDDSNYNDSILMLNLLNKYNIKALDMINGVFGFVYTSKDNVTAARDRLGIKPLYYSFINGDIIIASEIKAILKYKGEAIVNKEGLCELLGMLPSHSEGVTIYKDIYEIPMGSYISFNRYEFKVNKYYELKPREFNMSLEDTKSMIKHLLCDSIKKQVICDVPICSLLSGGLDSSIIVGVLKDLKDNFNTFSINYEDNIKDYQKNEFETSYDEDYVKLMNTNHTTVSIDNSTLVDYLKSAVIFRDSPGMTDIDASLYYLSKKIKNKYGVAFSGEISDEIFGGYPWYYKSENYNTFPWIRNLEYKDSLINKNLNLNIKSYILDKYNKCISNTPILENDSLERIKEREMYYLNYKYFMTSLIERQDRMSMGASLAIRAPFSDYRLVEFLYNVPFKYKYYDNKEKALLRDSMSEFIPIEIYNRKKSPYPKSRSKKYSKMIKRLFQETLKNTSSILYTLFDNDKLKELANTSKDLDVPWFGQLMRLDQLRAYLYQIDYWYKEYNIKLELN